MRVAKHLLISGRVQGVFFRVTMQQEADRLHLGGWVKNTFDGRVEAVIEGEEEAVGRMIAWAKAGPSRSRVDRVEIESLTTEDLKHFEIRG